MADTTVTAAGMRVIKLLVGKPPQTVADLMDVTGVTRTAVAEQLNDLMATGFVERTTERYSGRGRPRHRYTTTNAALLLLFANQKRHLGPCFWQAINAVCGDKLTQKVLDELSVRLADHYRRDITEDTPEGRLRQMNDLLHEEGVMVEVDEEDGNVTLCQRSCPFASLFEETRAACYVDQQVMSNVVGKPVRQTSCRHDGDPCCVFEIVPEDGSAGA